MNNNPSTPNETPSFSDDENRILDAGNSRFLSKPDVTHEFSKFPQIGLFQIRGNYFSIHENTNTTSKDSQNVFNNDSRESAINERKNPVHSNSDQYNSCLFLIHSERNRQSLMCNLMMKSWLWDFGLFIDMLVRFENGCSTDDDDWMAESFSIQWQGDSYRLGASASGQTPQFIADDLLILFLIRVCQTAIEHPEIAMGYDCDFESILLLLKPLEAKFVLKNNK